MIEATRGSGRTYLVPILDMETLENALVFAHNVDDEVESKSRIRISRKPLALGSPGALAALPAPSEDPFQKLDSFAPTKSTRADDYWSADSGFWTKWRADEMKARQASHEAAKSKLDESQKEAASAAAAAEQAREEKLRLKAEAKKVADGEAAKAASAEAARKQLPQPAAAVPLTPSHPVLRSEASISKFEAIMEQGKQFRSEFIQVWREISLSVSTTAANGRSIQQNANKLIVALTRASSQAGPSRASIVTWLCAVCGSKIVSQASTGNKASVWAFAYLARIVADRYPEVVSVGVIGELLKSGGCALSGTPGLSIAKDPTDSAKDFEIYARIWVAVMCVFGDESALWAWVASAVNVLRTRKSFLQSNEAMWSMMKVFIFMDVAIYDFRRMFGTQAVMIVDTLERTVFPTLDSELQNVSQSTSISVQFRFYLDACYNIIQSRKFISPPEGQVLVAAKESDLNPEL